MENWSTRFGHDRARRIPEIFRVFTFSFLLVYGSVVATANLADATTSTTSTNVATQGNGVKLGETTSPTTPVIGTVMRRRMTFSMRRAALLTAGGLQSGGSSETRFNGVRRTDAGTSGAKRRVLRTTAACRVGMEKAVRDYGLHAFEYPWRMGLATLGLRMVISAHDLVARYLGLEWQSLCMYVLAAFRRGSAYSTEAGLKYFIMGAVASGFYVRGAGMIYGSTGTLSFGDLSQLLSIQSVDAPRDPMRSMGRCRVLVMRLFKLAAAPFHAWILDVYEGSPSPTTLYFASVPKLAMVYVRLERCYGPFASRASVWQPRRRACGIASRIVAPLRALSQRRIKRFLAASAMGHVGYILLAMASLSLEGVQAARRYMAIYMITSVNVWVSVMSIVRTASPQRTGKRTNAKYLTDLGGLGTRNPFLAATRTVSMRSMAGVPPRGGFFAKRWVFFSTMSQGLIRVSIFAVLASCVGAFYYLRILKLMYFETESPSMSGSVLVPMDRGSSRVVGVSMGMILSRVFCPGPRRRRTHRMALALVR